MPQIQVTSIPRRLQKLLGLEGSAPTPTLSPQLTGIVMAADATEPWLYDPNATRIAGVYNSVAAGGAGAYSVVDLINPSSSGVLVELERATVNSPNTQAIQMRIVVAYPSAITGYGYYRDSRLGAGQTLVGTAASTPAVVTGYTVGRTYVYVANYDRIWDVPVVLGPGDAFRVACTAANTDLRASFEWREHLVSDTGV